MDNILLAAGYYHGNLVDITQSMVQIHQGRDTYRKSRIRGKKDDRYNAQFVRQLIKLIHSKYSIVRVKSQYHLKKRRRLHAK